MHNITLLLPPSRVYDLHHPFRFKCVPMHFLTHSHTPPTVPSFAAGAMLWMVLSDLIVEAMEDMKDTRQVAAIVLGGAFAMGALNYVTMHGI